MTDDETEVEAEAVRILLERNAVGRETYGKGLDYRDKNHNNWLREAIEEAGDMFEYLVAAELAQVESNRIEPTDEMIKSLGSKIYHDEMHKDFEQLHPFLKDIWYNEAREMIEDYNYMVEFLK